VFCKAREDRTACLSAIGRPNSGTLSGTRSCRRSTAGSSADVKVFAAPRTSDPSGGTWVERAQLETSGESSAYLMLKYSLTLAVLYIAGMPIVASSQERPSTPDMTCRQAKSVLSSRGALVMGTGGFTYDRFVRDRSFCDPTQVTSNAFVPTRDDPECLVGYRCIDPGRDWFGDDE
jgi:hypothetical protein